MQHPKVTISAALQQQAREVLKNHFREIMDKICKYEIPQGKLQEIFEYASKTKVKNAHLTNDRVVRKTVDYFKLKPKKVAETN